MTMKSCLGISVNRPFFLREGIGRLDTINDVPYYLNSLNNNLNNGSNQRDTGKGAVNMAFSSIAKDLNRSNIIRAAGDFAVYTKQDIARKTNLSFPTTGKIIDELVSGKMICLLSDKRGDTGGRKASEYCLNKEYAYSLCMILETGRVKAVVTNMDHENKSFQEKEITGEISVHDILGFIREQLACCPKIKSIAVGIPGAIHNGKIFLIDGFELLQDCELEKIIHEEFQLPTIVLNNMNALILGIGKEKKENIACIHIGEKGPGCSFLINGAPVSGFCGFQGEVGFHPFDGKRTFREIAQNGYRNVSMEDYIGKIAVQIITLINPRQLSIYSFENEDSANIKRYCLQYLPEKVMPQITYLNSYESDYICGLKKTGIELLFQAIC